MGYLLENIERLIEEACKRTGLKRDRLLLNAGLDPAQYRRYVRENRLFSDVMLDRFAEHADFQTTIEQLYGWRILDEYGESAIFNAVESALKRVSTDTQPSDDELIQLMRMAVQVRPELTGIIKREILGE